MAAPIIQSFTASPSTLPPGGSTVVTIQAVDPDNRVITMVGEVQDSEGNSAMGELVLTVGDPITYFLHDVNGAGLQIVPRAGQPGVFDVRVP